MSMSIQNSDAGAAVALDMNRLIERLHIDHPNLRVDEYDRIAKDSLQVREELERYVRDWFYQLIYPDYSRASYADVRGPEEVGYTSEITPMFDGLSPDALWSLADPSVIDMPETLRDALIDRLEETTGKTYAEYANGASVQARTSSSNLSSGGDDEGDGGGDSYIDASAFEGFTSSEDIDSVVNYFPPDSFAGMLFGFLGDRALLSRNIQGQSALSLAQISAEENRIMEELANLRESGLSPMDPEYMTRMEELKMESGNLSTSKEMYYTYIKQAQDSMQELVTMLSGILSEFNRTQTQIAQNMRMA